MTNKMFPHKAPSWLSKLPQLSHLLSQGGLTVGADIWIRIYDLLIAKHHQQNLPENPKDLQWSLSGLIVTNKDQQQQFNTLYKQWLDDIGYAESPQCQQAEQQKAQKEQEKQQKYQRKNRSIWKVIALTLALLSVLLVVIYSFLPNPPAKEPTPKQETIRTPTSSVPIIKSPIALQFTPIRQDLLPKEQVKPTEQQNYLMKLIEQYLPFLPALLLSLWLLAKWLRWQEVLRQQKGDPKDPLSNIVINNSEQTAQLFNSPVLSSALRALHNTVKRPSHHLAIEATANATARAAGYFSPVYQQRAFVPPCILMISYQHGRDQAAGLALLMQQRLVHAGLEVYTYLFQGTPQQLLPLDEQRWVSLEEVTRHYEKANLLLISDPDIYFSNWSGKLHPWVDSISQWQQRALLYTRPPSQTIRETFSKLSLKCAALSSEGLRQISQQFSGVNQQKTSPKTDVILPPVLARLNASDCYEEPDKETQTEQIQALEYFCNIKDLRLLSLIAAYPELYWVLTQRLESELYANDNVIQREQRLLRLLRLPWLRYGQIPEWLRRYLHQQQTVEQRQQAQEIYLRLFEQAQIEKKEQQHQLQLPFNPKHTKRPTLLRWLKLLKQANQNANNDSILQDQIFATTLLGKKSLDLDVLLPKTLAQNIPQGRWRSLYPRVAVVILLSVFLGALVQYSWVQYGKTVAQNYWLGDPQLIAQLENTRVDIKIIKPARFNTGAEMQRFEQQKQAAKVLQKALQQQGMKQTINVVIDNKMAIEKPNVVSRIQYNLQTVQVAQLIEKQLKHLSWGLAPELINTNTSEQNIQIQLNRLTQAATSFRDKAHILTAEQKIALAKPITKEQPLALQAFTLFSDSIRVQRRAVQRKLEPIPVPRMIVLPAGEFLAGAPDNESGHETGESPQHRIKIKAFAISQTEITFAQYDAFAKAVKRKKPDDNSGWGRGQRPVINVSWNDARAYVQWLSEQTGQDYRLPSEAEWEYAARAGTSTPFSTGECIHTDLANYDGTATYNDCGAKTDVLLKKTSSVRQLPPNPWGLFEVHGNVWEWVKDCWHDNYDSAPSDGSAWEKKKCDRRVIRGGGWIDEPKFLRSASRDWSEPNLDSSFMGFRIARAL